MNQLFYNTDISNFIKFLFLQIHWKLTDMHVNGFIVSSA